MATAGRDVINGTAGADTIDALGGDDTVRGGLGNDLIYGRDGEDELFGEDGNDRLFGGNQDDTLDGGTGADQLYGELGDDWLYGGTGNDAVYGGSGADVLVGGAGNDRIYGQGGADWLAGHQGSDVLYGGADRDIFSYGFWRDDGEVGGANVTLIADFVRGQDRLEIAIQNGIDVTFYGVSRFDTNRNGSIGSGDLGVAVRNVTVDGVTRASLVIDLEAARLGNLDGYSPGDHTITVFGVTLLGNADVTPSGTW